MIITGEGAYFGSTYIPSAAEAATIQDMTGIEVPHMAAAIDAEFGGGRGYEPTTIYPIDLDFGDAARKLGDGALGLVHYDI